MIKNIAIWVMVILLVVCTATFSFACVPKEQVYTHWGLGAVLTLVCYDDLGEKWSEYASQLLDKATQVFSGTMGDVATYNNAKDNEPVIVDLMLYQVLQVAKQAHIATYGNYDPTTARLVDLWGFSQRISEKGNSEAYDRTLNADGGVPLPDIMYIDALKNTVGLEKVELLQDKNGVCTLTKRNTEAIINGITYSGQLDLGGIAKGWVVQQCEHKAQELGIEHGYISFGTSSVALLTNKKGKSWDLSLTNPRPEIDNAPTYYTLPCANISVATAGDYENYYTINGTRYCHIISPITACPVQGEVVCVTIIGLEGAMADAVATGLMASSRQQVENYAYLQQRLNNGVQVVAVFCTNGNYSVFSTASGTKTLWKS